MAKFFFVEVTDTFGGEANYSWVTRHKVKAATIRGAVIRLNRDSGLGFHKVIDMGDTVRYDSHTGATCAFIEEWDNEQHSKLGRISTALS
jgi:hypothetical protein